MSHCRIMSSREIIIFNPLNTVDQGVEMFIREYKVFLGFTVSIIIFQGTSARTLTQIGLESNSLPCSIQMPQQVCFEKMVRHQMLHLNKAAQARESENHWSGSEVSVLHGTAFDDDKGFL